LPVYIAVHVVGHTSIFFYYWRIHHEETGTVRMEFFAEEKAFAEIVMDAGRIPTYGYRKMSFYLQRKKHPEATESV
jgi:hypothetical protein